MAGSILINIIFSNISKHCLLTRTGYRVLLLSAFTKIFQGSKVFAGLCWKVLNRQGKTVRGGGGGGGHSGIEGGAYLI